MKDEHLQVNLAHWDEIAKLHRQSYGVDALLNDPSALSDVAREDARLLTPFLPGGSVKGLEMIHLQCHIGHDTLSWARLGARMTGLDFSADSLQIARDLAAQTGTEIEYIQSSIQDAGVALARRSFDVVYTSVGVLCWLDDLEQWANLIASLLRPGGTFFIREDHPMVMALDNESPSGELRLSWPYFNTGPLSDDSPDDYSSPEPVQNSKTCEWSHSLGEIIGSLLYAGLTIIDFQEHRTMAWQPLPWMIEKETGFVLPEDLRDSCPLTFSLVAKRPDDKGDPVTNRVSVAA